MIGRILAGQIGMSLVLDHFGLVGYAQKSITWQRVLGAVFVFHPFCFTLWRGRRHVQTGGGMKRFPFLKVWIFAIVTGLALPVVAWAEMTVTVTNKTSKPISIAFRYKNVVGNDWVTQGWWNVEPMKVRNIALDTNNTVLYYYAISGNTWWGAQPNEKDSRQLPIVSNKFLVKGDLQPRGDNLKKVGFRRKDAENKAFQINLQGK